MKNCNRKLRMVTGNDVLIVGVDVAKKKHWATGIDGDGFRVTKPFSFKNSKDGFWRLVGKVESAKERSGAARVVVGLEPTGHYWKPLAWFLKKLGITVVIVNPYHVKRAKELEDNSPTKSDRKDAGIIAWLVKEGKFLNCILAEGIYADLRNLHTTRCHQRRQKNAALNRLQGSLDEYFPEFLSVFKNPLGKAASWVLKHVPFPDDIREVSVEELAECLKRASNGRVGLTRAQELKRAAEESIGISTGHMGARERLQSCLQEVWFWEEQMNRVEEKMAEALEKTGLAEFLLSVPGIGVITAAGFLGEVGDPAQYEHWRQWQKLAGLNLCEDSSGEKEGRRTIAKRGRAGLRSVLYKMSMVLVAKNAQFKALYQYFKNRPVNPLKSTQALVAIMVKLLRVLFTLVKKKTRYDAGKVLGRARLRQLGVVA